MLFVQIQRRTIAWVGAAIPIITLCVHVLDIGVRENILSVNALLEGVLYYWNRVTEPVVQWLLGWIGHVFSLENWHVSARESDFLFLLFLIFFQLEIVVLDDRRRGGVQARRISALISLSLVYCLWSLVLTVFYIGSIEGSVSRNAYLLVIPAISVLGLVMVLSAAMLRRAREVKFGAWRLLLAVFRGQLIAIGVVFGLAFTPYVDVLLGS